MQSGSDCTNRTSKNLRRLSVTQLLEFTKHYDFTISFRQTQNSSSNAFDRLRPRQIVQWPRLVNNLVKRLILFIVSKRHCHVIAPEASQDIIASDAEQK